VLTVYPLRVLEWGDNGIDSPIRPDLNLAKRLVN
jgi:hypothetical protein